MADARRKPNQAEKLLLGQGDLCVATGGLSLCSGSRWHCGAWVGHGEEPASPLSCPSGTGGRLCLPLPALHVPGCCPGSAGAAGDPRGAGRGCQPLPGPGTISRDPGVTVQSHTAWMWQPVCSAGVLALAVLFKPHQRDGKESCWTAEASMAGSSRVGL